MGKNASKNFVNQFKNTRRLAFVEQRKLVKGQAGGRPLVRLARHSKKSLFGERKNDKTPNHDDK
jgi:hypothetical protein